MSEPENPGASGERAPRDDGQNGTPHSDIAESTEFAETFADRWPGMPVAGTQLRHAAGDRWVRIHTLPGGRRIPAGPNDYATILARHREVISALDARDGSSPTSREEGREYGREYVIVAHSWSHDPEPIGLDAALAAALPDARWWRTTTDDADPDAPIHHHAYVAHVAYRADAEALDAVLRLTADDAAHDVIVTNRDAEWLYHPYDGGGDMIAATPERAQALAERFSAWTSSRPDGL